ncbi:MAG: DmsE family decaheme c-type cytochrome [Burkholderiales bacterium]|nr:DmsE family decaheme c-type cytochrome [Burkholderiales bacterium]
MESLLRHFGSQLVALALCLAPLAAAAVPAATLAEQKKASEACIECHDSEDLTDMSRSAHGFTGDKRIPQCTTCHGPSPTHVKKPDGVKDRPAPDITFRKKSANPAHQQSGTCLSCHDKDARRMLWAGSQHQAADVTCSNCHKVHGNKDKTLSKAGQTDTCFSCHKEQRAQMAKPSHHPVPEGKMACSDCHNPHGSAGPKLAKRDSTNATCYSCHTEKRGPFVHQHEPVADDCANCHNPHGSTVAGMLKARAPLLCQQCHTPHVAGSVGAVAGQPGVRTLAPGQVSPLITGTTGGKNVVNMWQGRSCLNCHTQVHGTNNPSATNPSPRLQTR